MPLGRKEAHIPVLAVSAAALIASRQVEDAHEPLARIQLTVLQMTHRHHMMLVDHYPMHCVLLRHTQTERLVQRVQMIHLYASARIFCILHVAVVVVVVAVVVVVVAVVVVVVVIVIENFVLIIRIPQAEDKLAVAANNREVPAANVAQKLQVRVVKSQLGIRVGFLQPCTGYWYTTNSLGAH